MIFDAQVRDLASDGRGIITTPQGETCFVAGVWQGEKIRVEKLAKKSKVVEARLLELIEPSVARRSAPCQYHGHGEKFCGGCAWQFVTYEAQLQAKQARIENQISRIIENPPIAAIQASPRELGYRNRAQLKTDGRKIGFEASQSHSLVAIDDCLVLSEKNRSNLTSLIETLPNKAWQKKPNKTKGRQKHIKKKWTTLDIDESLQAGEASVNQRLAFQQANSEQNNFMQLWLQNQLKPLAKDKPLLELFCGSGNFTRAISQLAFSKITAVELDARAIETLTLLKLQGVSTLTVNLFDEAGISLLPKQSRDAEILVLDPPRDGFKNLGVLLKKLKHLSNVFYISCDLATFSRDARMLLAAGFQLEELQPLDLFPQTPHVEVLAHFQKKL